MRHFDTDWLIGYSQGWLSPNVRNRVEQHLRICAFCAGETSQWISIAQALKAGHLQSAPPHAIRACEAIFPVAKPVSALRRIIAAVAFDSSLVPATAGVRGASGCQQLLLRSEEYDV